MVSEGEDLRSGEKDRYGVSGLMGNWSNDLSTDGTSAVLWMFAGTSLRCFLRKRLHLTLLTKAERSSSSGFSVVYLLER